MSLQSSLGKVRGLGSAKAGTDHWWYQRMTAIALIPLLIWFVVSLVSLIGADRQDIQDWLSSPISATLLIVLIIALFKHAALGVQVVVEDYVTVKALKLTIVIATNLGATLIAVLSVISVLRLAFGG